VSVEAVASAPIDEPGLAGIVVTLRLIGEQLEREAASLTRTQLCGLRGDVGRVALSADHRGFVAALPEVMERLAEILGADLTFVNRIDVEQRTVTVLADAGPLGKQQRDVVHRRWWQHVPGFVDMLVAGSPLVSVDLVAERPDWLDAVEAYFDATYRAAVIVPLHAHGRLVGQLGAVMATSPRPWTTDEVSAVQAIGDVIALAVLGGSSEGRVPLDEQSAQ
jgi:hypothetical protein